MSQHPKCIWTGKRDPRVKKVSLNTTDRCTVSAEKTVYVLPEYEKEVRKFNRRFVKYSRFFLFIIILLICLLSISVITVFILPISEMWTFASTGIITSLLGGTLVLFPFATPETIHWLRLKKAINITRFGGLLVMAIGMGILLYMVIT